MPDHHDAALIVQLARWATEMQHEEAVAEISRENFDPQSVTIEEPSVRRVLQFGETVGTLTQNGLLDQGLVLDWIWFAGLWERVGPAALREREKRGVPELFENFQALAKAQG